MTIKFTGYLTEVATDNKGLKNVFIGLRIYEAESNEIIASLYDMLENGQPIEVILGGNPKPIKIQEIGYAILQENSLYHLRNSVLDFQEEGWSCIGASYWHDNLIYQTMVRRKD